MNFLKLASLPRSMRIRKIAKMFGEAEYLFCSSGAWTYSYNDLIGALAVLVRDTGFPQDATAAFANACETLTNHLHKSDDEIRRTVNTVKHILLAETGQTPADWDFLDASSRLDVQKRRIFSGMQVYLEDIRSPFNVGSMFRIAESFGVEKALLSPFTADPLHKRAARTAMGCVSAVPWERILWERVSQEKRVFAVETGGTALPDFHFPASGIMIVGSEELGVSPNALAAADASWGRVSIPLYGAKGSLNVSAAFAIAMQAWAASLVRLTTGEAAKAQERF
jgi:TrmH family RNA methyltransferase